MTNTISVELYRLSEKLYQYFLSKTSRERSERAILWIALVSFIIHLVLIGLVNFNIIALSEPNNLLKNPIAAIYTPFSFILVYEVYLLVYYLPKSTSIYISKQYEIITLIIIRRLFKDLSVLSLSTDWFRIKMIYNLPMTSWHPSFYSVSSTSFIFSEPKSIGPLNQT